MDLYITGRLGLVHRMDHGVTCTAGGKRQHAQARDPAAVPRVPATGVQRAGVLARPGRVLAAHRTEDDVSGQELAPELNWTCGLSPYGYLECLDAATWHGFRLTDDGLGIECMMASCDAHRARMEADYEHPMQSACGITGSRFVWPENYCYIDWGDEPSLVGDVQEPVPAGAP